MHQKFSVRIKFSANNEERPIRVQRVNLMHIINLGGFDGALSGNSAMSAASDLKMQYVRKMPKVAEMIHVLVVQAKIQAMLQIKSAIDKLYRNHEDFTILKLLL